MLRTASDLDGPDTLEPKAPKGTPAPKRKVRNKVIVTDESEPYIAIELRKAVQALTIRNVSNSGEITFLQRKAYNAMLQIAQRYRKSNEVTFEVPITEFEALVGHKSSNNRDHLKQMLRQLASIQVEFDFRGESQDKKEKSDWGLANLISEVYLTDHERKVRFSFPPDFAIKLLDPDMYNRLDMRMQNLFTSYSALTLYEICSRYYGFEQRETFRRHWTTWSTLLSGMKEPHGEFRDFNKMLNRAIDQVNTHEKRFKIVPHFVKRQRKFDQLWFVLEDQQQSQLPLGEKPAAVSEELESRLKAFGLSSDEISRLTFSHDEEYLLAQADYTDKRIKRKGVEPLANPRAFFISAIEKNFSDAPRRQAAAPPVEGPPQITNAKAKKPDAKQTLALMRTAWKTAKLEEIRTQYYQLDDDRKREVFERFEDQLREQKTVWQQFKKSGMTKIVETALIDHIFIGQYQEPSAEELLQFALESGSLLNVA